MSPDIKHMGLIICGLMLICILISPVTAELSIEKTVLDGTFYEGDEVTWIVNITNTGGEVVNDIVIQEDASNLKNVTWKAITPSKGSYNAGTWSIDLLSAGESANLTIVTSFSYAEEQTNRVNITSIDGGIPDPLLEDTETIMIGRTFSATMEIKPETLNLKSKGVFTVFINVTGMFDDAVIDLANSSITCNESVLRKLILSDEEDGKLIAKFERTTLNVTANDPTTISCVGYVKIGEETIKVEGSDAIRVIKERPAESFLDKLLKFLGFKNDENEETGEETALSVLSIPDTIKNLGQAKQYIKDTPSDTSSEDELEVTEEEGAGPSVIHGGKPEKEQNNDTPDMVCNEGKCIKEGKEKGN